MGKSNCLMVLDPDPTRRTTIVREISKDIPHVEPYEGISELDHWWNEQSVLLLYDQDDVVSDVIAKMNEKGIYQPIIAYSSKPSVDQVVNAVLQGALDYMEWPFQGRQLVSHLEIVKHRFAELGGRKHASNQAKNRIERLTSRELEVLSLLAGGRTNSVIADKLNISPRTVEVHRANMMTKLNAKHVAEAIQTAFDADVVVPRGSRKDPPKTKAA